MYESIGLLNPIAIAASISLINSIVNHSHFSVVPFFLTIPNMLFFTLSPSLRVNRESGLCYTEYRLIIDNRGLDSWGLDPFTLNLWLYSILLKLVPCLVLTIFTACLIHAMYQACCETIPNTLKLQLNQAAENAAKLRGGREGKKSKQNNSTEKTTKLLIVIVILFLVAEFPMVMRYVLLKSILSFAYFGILILCKGGLKALFNSEDLERNFD